jgi:hypothetical protein
VCVRREVKNGRTVKKMAWPVLRGSQAQFTFRSHIDRILADFMIIELGKKNLGFDETYTANCFEILGRVH